MHILNNIYILCHYKTRNVLSTDTTKFALFNCHQLTYIEHICSMIFRAMLHTFFDIKHVEDYINILTRSSHMPSMNMLNTV